MCFCVRDNLDSLVLFFLLFSLYLTRFIPGPHPSPRTLHGRVFALSSHHLPFPAGPRDSHISRRGRHSPTHRRHAPDAGHAGVRRQHFRSQLQLFAAASRPLAPRRRSSIGAHADVGSATGWSIDGSVVSSSFLILYPSVFPSHPQQNYQPTSTCLPPGAASGVALHRRLVLSKRGRGIDHRGHASRKSRHERAAVLGPNPHRFAEARSARGNSTGRRQMSHQPLQGQRHRTLGFLHRLSDAAHVGYVNNVLV